MNSKSLAWEFLKTKNRQAEAWTEVFWITIILLASLVIFTLNLDGVPLQDWDEAIVAQVAKEIWQSSPSNSPWAVPTLWGKPYLDHPPLHHWLIAGLYSLAGVHEWTTRLPSAILTAFSTLLLYGMGREIFPQRLGALLSAFIYLTLLPVVWEGRLAMLDGPIIFWGLFMIGSVLKSRRDLRYSWGVGLGLSALSLMDARIGFFWLLLSFLFLILDTPRLLTSRYAILGFGLGLIPAIAWYGTQFNIYDFPTLNLGSFREFGDSLFTFWQSLTAEMNRPEKSVLDVVKYNWPWLIFLPVGLLEIFKHRNLSGSKLILIWMGLFLLFVTPFFPQIPGAILSVYPAIALCVGRYLSEVWNHWPLQKSYPHLWSILLGFLGLGVLLGGLIYNGFGKSLDPYLLAMTASGILTLWVAALLILQRDLQFIPILCWGSYISFIILMLSPHWSWEMNRSYPVQPVAAMIRQNVPPSAQVYGLLEKERPSLNFYSDRPIAPISEVQLEEQWQASQTPYILIAPDRPHSLQLPRLKTLQQSAGWLLITRQGPPQPLQTPKPKRSSQPLLSITSRSP